MDGPLKEKVEEHVKAIFPIGCRVKLESPSGPKRGAKLGTVLGYRRGGLALDGVDSFCCPEVRWDGNKGSTSFHYSMLIKV